MANVLIFNRGIVVLQRFRYKKLLMILPEEYLGKKEALSGKHTNSKNRNESNKNELFHKCILLVVVPCKANKAGVLSNLNSNL